MNRLPVEPIVQPAQMNASPPPPLFLRSPLRDISPPQPDLPHNDDEILENRKRRIPSSSVTQTDSQTISTQSEYRPIASSSRVASSSARAATTTTSPYFPSASQHGAKDSQATRPLFAQHSIIDMTQAEPITIHRNDHQMHIDWESDRQASSKGKEKAGTNRIDEDEFEEDNFYMDQAFLESLDRADVEARRISNEPIPNPLSSTAGSASIPRNNGADIIEIADDDCEDKENIPVATRHVRRRTDGHADIGRGSQPVTSGDVIDLSDSD